MIQVKSAKTVKSGNGAVRMVINVGDDVAMNQVEAQLVLSVREGMPAAELLANLDEMRGAVAIVSGKHGFDFDGECSGKAHFDDDGEVVVDEVVASGTTAPHDCFVRSVVGENGMVESTVEVDPLADPLTARMKTDG